MMNNNAPALRSSAPDLADEGHYGSAHLMNDAAFEIEQLRAWIGRQHPGFDVDEAIDLFDPRSTEKEPKT